MKETICLSFQFLYGLVCGGLNNGNLSTVGRLCWGLRRCRYSRVIVLNSDWIYVINWIDHDIQVVFNSHEKEPVMNWMALQIFSITFWHWTQSILSSFSLGFIQQIFHSISLSSQNKIKFSVFRFIRFIIIILIWWPKDNKIYSEMKYLCRWNI